MSWIQLGKNGVKYEALFPSSEMRVRGSAGCRDAFNSINEDEEMYYLKI